MFHVVHNNFTFKINLRHSDFFVNFTPFAKPKNLVISFIAVAVIQCPFYNHNCTEIVVIYIFMGTCNYITCIDCFLHLSLPCVVVESFDSL